MIADRKTLSIAKAGELVGVSRRTIYNWIAGGKVEYVRTAGGSVRIFVDTLWRRNSSSRRAGVPPHLDLHRCIVPSCDALAALLSGEPEPDRGECGREVGPMKGRLPVNQAALDVDLVGGVPVFLRRSGQLANPGRQPAQPTVAGRRNVPFAGVRGGRIDALGPAPSPDERAAGFLRARQVNAGAAVKPPLGSDNPLHDVRRSPHRGGRIPRDHLTDHEPIEQPADGGQVLLESWGLWRPRRMSCSRAASEERGRLCQEQMHVLAEQFSSIEHDGFRGPYLSDNTPEAAFHGQAGRAAGRAGDLRAHRGHPLPWAKFLGPKARRSGTAPHWAGRQVATRCRCGPGAVLRATSHREHPVDPAR